MTLSIVLLVASQMAVLSLWFSAAAILPPLAAAYGLESGQLAGLSTATQIGFVAGALVLAVTGLPDRVDPRRLFALSAVLAALANIALLVVHPLSLSAMASRALVGFALAGVYPVGLKIAVGWSVKRRGLITSLLVGALTIGSAMPHLVSLLGGAEWRWTLMATSGLALLGGVAILAVSLGPHHRRAGHFDIGAIAIAWKNRNIRNAYLGYFGHMWELYAFWAWVGVAASAAAANAFHPNPIVFGSAVAFAAIACGGLACVPAGWLADRFGKAKIARAAMICSAASGIAAAASFHGPLPILAAALMVWGLTIIPDSAQFSAMVADHAPAERVGSLMTLQTALGFALTAVTVQGLPQIVAVSGWPVAFLVLALGPVFGAVAVGSGR